MTQEELNTILESDSYYKDRKNPTEPEIRLFLREVAFHCPLCGVELQSRKQKKPNSKLFQIAHIHPNRPTIQQYLTLHNLVRLGDDSESFENKIALCPTCHITQDYHTSKDDYLKLVSIKKRYLLDTAINDATASLNLESEIEIVVNRLSCVSNDEIAKIVYDPISISRKIPSYELLLKMKISSNVQYYYPLIRDCFRNLDGKDGFVFQVLASQIRACFLKIDAVDTTSASNDKQTIIFNHIVQWIKTKTQSNSLEACEAVVSFFVQECEVFNEITQ